MKRKTCIVMERREFEDMFMELFGDYDDVDVEINQLDGLYFCGIADDEAYEKIGEYLGESVSSIHTDHYDYQLIWVVLED